MGLRPRARASRAWSSAITFGATKKRTAIQCQQYSGNLDKVHFWTPPTTYNCMQNFSGGQNFSFPALLDCYRESLLITISPNKCQMRVLTRTKLRYCSIVYTFYGSSQHQFFLFWRALTSGNNNTKLFRMKDRRLSVGWFTIILREIPLSRWQFGSRSSGEWINVLYSFLPLMFPTHNPYYGSKQLNQNNCAEKG